MGKPKKIVASLQSEIDSAVDLIISESSYLVFPDWFREDWDFFITDTVRGRASLRAGNVTVPLWAYEKGTDYFLYS